MEDSFNLCKKIDCRTIKSKNLNLNIEYSDNFIQKIVNDSFVKADKIEELPKIMTNKKKYNSQVISAIKEIREFFDGSIKQEYPLIFDYEPKNYSFFCRYGDKVFKHPEKIDFSSIMLNNNDTTPYHLYEGLYYKNAGLLACKNGHLQILKNNFESCNRAKDLFNDNYLINASKNGHEDIVIYLIDRGLNVNLALEFGTKEIKKITQEWLDSHPSGQNNLDKIKQDYDNMLNNPPEWMNRFSHFRLKVSKKEHYVPSNIGESINMVIESVAYIRNNSGENAVQKYLDSILLKEPHKVQTLEECLEVGKKLCNVDSNNNSKYKI
jgi:hypothetical protein